MSQLYDAEIGLQPLWSFHVAALGASSVLVRIASSFPLSGTALFHHEPHVAHRSGLMTRR
jgi:hypothetical protein